MLFTGRYKRSMMQLLGGLWGLLCFERGLRASGLGLTAQGMGQDAVHAGLFQQ